MLTNSIVCVRYCAVCIDPSQDFHQFIACVYSTRSECTVTLLISCWYVNEISIECQTFHQTIEFNYACLKLRGNPLVAQSFSKRTMHAFCKSSGDPTGEEYVYVTVQLHIKPQ